MKRILLVLGALAVAATVSGNAAAQQYKWTDRDGKVQYGDVPPPGVKATQLKAAASPAARPGAASDSAPAANDAKKGPLTPAEQEADFRKRKLDADAARAKDESAAKDVEAKREACKSAQAYQRQLETGQRVARVDANGERSVMEDDQRAAEIAKARKIAGESCS
jgi:hypothetical protein